MALQLTNVLVPASGSPGTGRLASGESALGKDVNLLKNNDISSPSVFGEVVREVSAGNAGLAVGRSVSGVDEANPIQGEIRLALTQLQEQIAKLLESGAVPANDAADQQLQAGNNVPSSGKPSPLQELASRLAVLLAGFDGRQSSVAGRGGEFPGADSTDFSGKRADPHSLLVSGMPGSEQSSLSHFPQLAQDLPRIGGLNPLAGAESSRPTILNLLDTINEQFTAASANGFIDREAVDQAVNSSLAVLSVIDSNINAGVGLLPNLAIPQGNKYPGIAGIDPSLVNSANELAKGQTGRPVTGNAQMTGMTIDALQLMKNPQPAMGHENSSLALPGNNHSLSATVDAGIKPVSTMSIHSTTTLSSSSATEQLLNAAMQQGIAQTETASTQEARGGLQGLLASASGFTALPVSGTGGAISVTNDSSSASLFQSQISQPVTSEQWGAQFGQRLAWLAGQGIKAADIHLNPPELGSLQVRIEQTDSASRVIFAVQHAATRETLEMHIPRLRDLFADQGLTLVDVESHDMSSFTSQDSGAGQNEPGTAEDNLAEVSSTENSDIASPPVNDGQAPGLIVLNYGYIDAYA